MSHYCQHMMVWGRCPTCRAVPWQPNVDRHGMPLDYETYVAQLYPAKSAADQNPWPWYVALGAMFAGAIAFGLKDLPMVGACIGTFMVSFWICLRQELP